jgi:malonyl CoA-acyl carrier protein transacylase
MVAGHSLGELSALGDRRLEFEDGLNIVSKRAQATAKGLRELKPSTMAAILSLEDGIVEVHVAKFK